MTPKTIGKHLKEILDKVKLNMITLRIFTKPSNKVHKKKKANIEQINTATPRKKRNGEVDTPKRRKIFSRKSKMAIPSDTKKVPDLELMVGTQRMLQILTLNTTIRYLISTNSKRKELVCSKRKRKYIRSTSQRKILISTNKIGDFKLGKTSSAGLAGKLGLIL